MYVVVHKQTDVLAKEKNLISGVTNILCRRMHLRITAERIRNKGTASATRRMKKGKRAMMNLLAIFDTFAGPLVCQARKLVYP